ncbi:hypothetical protein ANCDUO_08353 [Ancylostoma duodenale]|uniref:Uncharacterized protein n=1 Tax=Ancylostoma duodenale TaxID=51022 RepID=A0A0C2DG11_9BILA|nr:hypothetical protein ANCDUO_08353 [Ancylostoma duodenale]
MYPIEYAAIILALSRKLDQGNTDKCHKKTTIGMYSQFIEDRNKVVWNYDLGVVELSQETATIECKK